MSAELPLEATTFTRTAAPEHEGQRIDRFLVTRHIDVEFRAIAHHHLVGPGKDDLRRRIAAHVELGQGNGLRVTDLDVNAVAARNHRGTGQRG